MIDPPKPDASPPGPVEVSHEASAFFDSDQAEKCRAMVEKQLRSRHVSDLRVLDAMMRVPRHAFVPAAVIESAYEDKPLPIGEEQTISQPYMVAAMTEALELAGTERVLEIGAGSGYQTAVLALLAREVHAIERFPELARSASERLNRLGVRNVHMHIADGTLGWPAEAPYDAILVTAAAPHVPSPLIDQLAEGGRMVLPVGPAESQWLLRVRRRHGEIFTQRLFQCRFVPLVGAHGWASAQSGG